MAVGPGKYDRECELTRITTQAEMVLLMVLGGNRGSGFSVTVHADMPTLLREVPRILRETAKQIEQDIERHLTESLGDPH